jgi:hypothetical protein
MKRFLLAGLAAAAVASSASAQVKVQMRPTWINPTDNQIAVVLNVVNTGSTTVALSNVTVRYYFTKDGTASLSYFCDYTPVGCGNVTGTFAAVSPAAATADTYFQIGFSSGAGSLAPGASTGDIQLRIAKSDWSNFNEANDWSYAANASSADNANITAYVSGTLVWGNAPPTGTTTSDFQLAASPTSLSINQGASGTSTVTITRTNFTGAIAFTASGLPSGVTASFNPASATANSTVLTLTASSTATTGGPTTVTITGTSGTTVHTATVALTVNSVSTANFTLAASPTSLSINQGASGTSTITITRTNFTSAVAFTASGLPSGVTASFNPASATANSTVLTLTASSTATVGGPTTVTITGTGGGLTKTTTVALTVNSVSTANFSLAASPTSLSINQGASGTSTISITRTNFTSAVAFTASGMPSGVTASFNPSSTTANSTVLTLTASSTATTGGPVTVTITGTGGGLTKTTTVALTVNSVSTGTFTLAASPTSVSIAQGSSSVVALTITRTNFTASVALTASGLPTGVTATFTPSSTTTNASNLTLAASSTAATGGPVNVTVTGTGSGVTATATVALTVTPASTNTNSVWRIDTNGRVTRNSNKFLFHCGSWFGLQGRYEIATDSANPRGAPMEQYVGNTFWASNHNRTVMQTFTEIKAQGISVIRLPVVHQTLDATDPQGKNFLKNYSGIINDPTYPMTNSRQGLESMLKAANAAGIYVLLDIHSCSNWVDWRKGRFDARPPWTDATRANYDFKREEYSCASTNNPSTVTHTNPYNSTIWLQDLQVLAGLNKQLGIDSVMGIDIFNEPWDYSWTEWKGFIEQAYTAINGVNPNILIFAQGISDSHGNELGPNTTPSPTPFGASTTHCSNSGAVSGSGCSVNPNWGENLYEAGTNPPNVPKTMLVFSPHTYGPSVFVQQHFMDPAQPACAGLSGDDAAAAKCNIVINPTLLKAGWEEHFGYLKQQGWAVIVGEWGGNLQWPKGKASQRDQQMWSFLTSTTTDQQWQNAFSDYMVSKQMESCYWSINPESGDTGGWYTTSYDPISNTGGWGDWTGFDSAKTSLLQKVWNGAP